MTLTSARNEMHYLRLPNRRLTPGLSLCRRARHPVPGSPLRSQWRCGGWCLSLIAVLAGFSGSPQAALAQPPKTAEVDTAIRLSGSYIVRQARENGRFVYRTNTNPKVPVPRKYNMLRHAGAMYALASYWQLHPSPEGLHALKSANTFLLSQVRELDDVPDTMAVWSDPGINRGTDPLRAKLGGTGLGLVAMTAFERLVPGSTPKKQLECLGNFLLFMQRDDGGFYTIYYPVYPGRDDSWTSLYYPGEAALGLLMLNDILPSVEWVRGAKEALLFLARERKTKAEVPADHWALIATQKLFADATSTNDRERDALVAHARQVVRFMLSEYASQRGDAELDGCFSADGRTTPTATRLEGLLAATRILSEDDVIQAEINDALRRGTRFLLRSQIQSGDYAGGIPRAVARLPETDPNWSESFNLRATEIRIDYVQHALSAFIGYRRWLQEASGAAQ